MSTLETLGVSVSYGGVRAVVGVSVSLDAGSAVGLIGPNGAGKTSFLDGITGLTPAKGTVLLKGEDISTLSAHGRARLGLRRTWQSVELFEDLTVAENLAVSADSPTLTSGFVDLVKPRKIELRARALETLSMFGFERFADEMPYSLSLGHQKLVGVARALVSRPSVLGLDEPAAGLDRYESREFGRHVRSITDAGIALLLIDHDMELVLNVCDYVYVLDFGQIIAAGNPSEIRSDEKVLTAYLGRDARAERSLPPAPVGDEAAPGLPTVGNQ